jgi:hypothetical protein
MVQINRGSPILLVLIGMTSRQRFKERRSTNCLGAKILESNFFRRFYRRRRVQESTVRCVSQIDLVEILLTNLYSFINFLKLRDQQSSSSRILHHFCQKTQTEFDFNGTEKATKIIIAGLLS